MTSRLPGQPPGSSRRLLIANLLAQLAFGLTAMTLCLPSMQEWGATFGADQSAVQLTFSGYMVAYGTLQLIYGPLSDRFGRKRILLAGLLLGGVGSILAALAADIVTLTAARIVQGAGGAASMVVGRALVQDLFEGSERTRIMAYVGMVLGFVPPMATLVGGQMHTRFGWQANFVLAAAFAVALMLAAWRGLPSRPQTPPTDSHWLGAMFASYSRLAREPAFLLYVSILSFTTTAFFVFLAGAPIVLDSYGVGPEGIGWYIMCVPITYIAGNYVASRLIRRVGERPMMVAGQAAAICGLVLMLALGMAGLKTPLALALPLMLLGAGHGILMPPVLAGTLGVIPALAGSAAAVAGLTQQLMGAVGGYAVGLLHHDGAVNLGLLMLGFTLLAVGAQALLHRRLPDHSAPL